MNLVNNEIHIWQIDLHADESQINAGIKILDTEEQGRAERFKFAVHRRRFVKAHFVLRTILAKYCNCGPEKIIFAKYKHEKPYLKDYADIQFNLSHSEELALCVITLHTPLGVDIEYHKENTDYLNIAKRFFSPTEYTALADLSSELQPQGFYNAWTRKEAFIKAIGDGLHFPLDQFSVSLAPNAPVEILNINRKEDDAKHWELLSFTPKEKYTAALAIQRRSNLVKWYGI
jgi:4'-phosphopantetheinyl transferase